MPDKKYDWPDMKAKYETGGYTYDMLADEYGGNAKYIARKGKKQGWKKGKRREKVEKEAAKKVLDYQSTTEADLRNEFAKIFRLLREKTVEEVMLMYSKTKDQVKYIMDNDADDLDLKMVELIAKASEDRLKAMRAATHVINNCRQNEWEIYEIQEVAKKLEQDIRADINEIDFSGITNEDLKKMIHDDDEEG